MQEMMEVDLIVHCGVHFGLRSELSVHQNTRSRGRTGTIFAPNDVYDISNRIGRGVCHKRGCGGCWCGAQSQFDRGSEDRRARHAAMGTN